MKYARFSRVIIAILQVCFLITSFLFADYSYQNVDFYVNTKSTIIATPRQFSQTSIKDNVVVQFPEPAYGLEPHYDYNLLSLPL